MTDPRPVFDREVFERQIGGDRALALEVLQMFIEDCPERVAAIRAAVEQGDASALCTAAHTLKGSAGYLAAAHVVDAAARLERIGREGPLADAPAAVVQLEGAVARLMPEIQRAALAS
jgi:HPt (histidine-containing phosphotransfer) domain-containing protein